MKILEITYTSGKTLIVTCEDYRLRNEVTQYDQCNWRSTLITTCGPPHNCAHTWSLYDAVSVDEIISKGGVVIK